MLLALLTLAVGLAACGGDEGGEAAPPAEPAPAEPAPAEPAPAEPPAEPAPAEPPAETEPVKIALDFTPNTNHAGIYIALANGFFEEQGIDAEVIPYAFGTAPTTLVDSGEADLAVAFPADVAIQVASGTDLKMVAEIIQVNNASLVALADAPYASPADFNGTRYGGYGTPHEAPIVTAILEGDGVTNPNFEEVILSTGAIEALTGGDVDFSAVYEGWSEIGAEIAGSPLKTFPYKDYVEGYIFPDVVFVTSGDSWPRRAMPSAARSSRSGRATRSQRRTRPRQQRSSRRRYPNWRRARSSSTAAPSFAPRSTWMRRAPGAACGRSSSLPSSASLRTPA